MFMKKQIFSSLIFLCLFVVLGQAQDDERRFQLALVGGFNMAQLDGDDLVGYNQIGLNAGAKLYTNLAEKWRFSFEMLFSQQGSNRGANDALSAAIDKIRLNFVEVPFLIHFQDWKFEVGTGVSYARLIDYTTIDFTGEDVSDLQDYSTDIVTWVGDINFFFQENIALNVRWSRNINSIRADEGSGRLIGKFVTVRGLYLF